MPMTRRILFAFVVAALAACSRAQPGADPVAAVQPIYAPYIENRNPPALLDVAPWTPELRALLQSAQAASRETGEPVIDFDPIIDGQDWQIAAVAVTLESPPADGRAEVAARFNNQGDEVEVIFELVDAEGGWRVDNLRTENWSLRAILATAGIAEE